MTRAEDMQAKSKIQNLRSKILVELLIATFLRLHQLPHLPPGLNFDEAGNGVAALDILSGGPQIWWRIGGGKEPLWPYLIAVSTLIFGPIPLALRFPAVLAGILTIAAVYPLTLTLFKDRLARGRAVALLAMLGLALSGWHLHFSRLGFRAILLPLLSTAAFYFFWRALTHSQFTNRNARLSGLFIALSIYSYLGARLLPFVIILYLVLTWLMSRLQCRGSSHNRPTPTEPAGPSSPNLQSPISNLLFPLSLSLLLFLSPLILYFIIYPADLVARSSTVSIFNPAWNNGNLAATAWRTLKLTAGTYLGLHGDTNALVNLPGQPALPPLLVPFFLLGNITAIYQTARALFSERAGPYPIAPSPYLFLLCWWTILFLPAILAPEGAPHHLRLLGTIVPTYILIALGFMTAVTVLTKLFSQVTEATVAGKAVASASAFAYLLPIVCYILLGLQSYSNTFIRWPNSTDFTLPFDLYATRLAADISQAPPNVAYLLPMDIRAAEEARHYSLDYLLGRPASTMSNEQLARNNAYAYIPVDERNSETYLSQAAVAKDELRVVRWTADKHREADAKEIVTFLLETNAQLSDRQSFPVYDIETYLLPDIGDSMPRPAFALPAINRSLGYTFDGLLRLDAAFVDEASSGGDRLAVALTLAPLAPMEADYKVSLRLLDSSGGRLVQKDRALMHNFHQGTSLWPPETVNEYYLLPIPPETPPGAYTVTLVIYHPDTLTPLISDGQAEVSLGAVRIN